MKLRKYRFAAKMHSGNQAELSSEVWISLNGFGELLQALLHMGGLSDAMQREDAFSVVFEARLIVGQRKSHVFSQPPAGYSRMSTAPPAPSCGHTRIKGRPLIEPLIDADHGVIRAIRGPSIYRKVLPA